MKNSILKIMLTFVCFALFSKAMAQQSITSINVAQTQNFDGIGTSTTATLPTGFRGNIGNGNWADGLTATTQAAGTTGTGVLTGTSGGGFYNFANGITASSTERSIGYLTSGSYLSPRDIFYAFTNNTGSTVTSIDLAWDYEKYRSGSRAFDWTFFHGSNGNSITTAATAGDQSYAADANNTVIFNPPTAISKSFSITGLNIPDGTTYYLRWRFTGVGGSTNGQAIAIDNFSITLQAATLCSAPATQALNITFSNVSDGSMDLSWTNGSGDGRVVIINTSNSFTAPGNGTNPSVNTVYSGSGEQVIFNGTGNSVSVSGLSASTTYWFRVYEFCNPDRVYQTSSATNNPSSQATIACLTSTHYYRTIATGNWNSISTWESSSDEITWGTPSCVPDFNANTIRIRNGHTVTINTALDVDQIIIENGGILRKESGAAMFLRNGTDDDILIQNGGVLQYAGANIPTYQNTDVRIRVQSGGRIRVTNNVSGISNNLGGNGSSNRIIYEHQSIFEWNNGTAVASSDQVYFPDVDAVTIPTFLLSANSGNVGANAPNNLTFNGVFEANGNITFTSDGEKYFRNGIIGTGNVSQTSTTGRFYITGATAYLGGTGVINLDFERINVNPGVNLILTSNKTINTTNAYPSLGQLRMTDGSTIDMGPYELSGTANVRFNTDVVIRTTHPNGLDGAFTGLAASDFVTPLNQTFDFYGVGSQFSGFVSPGACANLIVGAGTWLQVVENLDVSNTITMNAGSVIIVAAGETLRLTNPSVGALVGGNLVGATNYIHGRLQRATTTGNTYQFPMGFPPYSAQGFTITVTGSGEILGNMESNTSAPLLDYVYCDLETPTIPGQQIGQGLPVQDGILDQMFLDLQSPAQWEITNPGGGIISYDLVLSANGMNDIMPTSSAGGTPIRFVMKNGEPGNTGVGTTSTAEFPQIGFDACPNGYTLTGMTGFSTFTINGSSAPNTALPVELLFFSATVNNQKQVILNWATASELNNDFFTVERSIDGLNWEVVEFVNGNGTTPLRNDYSTTDIRPFTGLSYYRLKQTDFDGAFEYSYIVSVFIDGEEKSLIKVVNLIGQEVDINTRGMVILIFSDGSTMKLINE